MKRVIYIIFAFLLLSCVKENFPGEQINHGFSGVSSQIQPAARVNSATLPPAATKALISAGTVASMEANALRIDEGIDEDGKGTYSYAGWDQAYLLEATVASSPSSSSTGYLRSMYLNPAQAYKLNIGSDNDTTDFYHTRMVSWYPKTCNLYKDDKGNAVVTQFASFRDGFDKSAYSIADNHIVLNFPNLDGSKDVMVSNIVEGQHWHRKKSDEINYAYPFGQNDSRPSYTNILTYKHYLSAVKVYAYAQNSDQVVSMWGAIKKVMVKNQPSSMSVVLPNPGEMRNASFDDFVQQNASSDADYGSALFSTETVDFPLIKTAMFGDDPNNPKNEEVAEDSPSLMHGQGVYLGYALIKPNVGNNQKLELDIHTESGVLSVSVPMTVTNASGTVDYFKAGYIYGVDIKFNTEGAIADIVLNAGSERYFDLSSGDDFSSGDGSGTSAYEYKFANCYIVNPDGAYDGYAFNATTVGNGQYGLYANSGFDRTSVNIDPVRASLLWESSQGLVTQVELLYGYVRFKVKPGVEGNAVIAVYDSQRKVLWSWHIWVTDTPEDVSYMMGGNLVKLMDRNLGATSASPDDLHATYGLYYQWGRKDPSMGPPSAQYIPQSTETFPYYDYYGSKWNYAGVMAISQPTLRDGVENPMYLILPTDFSMTTYQYDWLYTNIDNLWGDYDHSSKNSVSKRQKTIYDPCPFGYMVPQDEITTLFTSNVATYLEDKGMKINDSFFPFAGYKGVDKGVSSLSGAWRYVGAKGDYMSSKIDANGHRSRTYISNASSWVEYGADNDGDGDGDAERRYTSRIYADEVANRRTAASVRCVKRENALNASIYSRFVADRSYAFVGDELSFTYSAHAYGVDDSGNPAVIYSAYIDVNESETPLFTLSAGKQGIEGSEIISPSAAGAYRYRLVAKSSTGAASRVSCPIRIFDLDNITIVDARTGSVVESCIYGTKYNLSFDIDGLEQGFAVYVNGVAAVNDSGARMTCEGLYVSGHLHFQICDSNGGVVASKEYTVPMESIERLKFRVPLSSEEFSPNVDDAYIIRATDLEAGALYLIGTFKYSTPWFNPNYWSYNEVEATPAFLDFPGSYEYEFENILRAVDGYEIEAEQVFMFHRDDSKAGGVSAAYHFVAAGAWRSLKSGKYLTENFTFSDNEADAVYTTLANGWDTPGGCIDIDFYLGNTGQFLQCDRWAKVNNTGDYFWWNASITNEYKWRIYKIEATVVTDKGNDGR